MDLNHPLLALLPRLLPLATRWVQAQEADIIANGAPLTPDQLQDARRAGVVFSEKIRLRVVPEIPVPDDAILNNAARETGLLGPGTAGLTLRYGIYIRDDGRLNRELHAHEFVHVAQYERLGSIEAFLSKYLQECIDPGYPSGPLEREAILTARKIIRGL